MRLSSYLATRSFSNKDHYWRLEFLQWYFCYAWSFCQFRSYHWNQHHAAGYSNNFSSRCFPQLNYNRFFNQPGKCYRKLCNWSKALILSHMSDPKVRFQLYLITFKIIVFIRLKTFLEKLKLFLQKMLSFIRHSVSYFKRRRKLSKLNSQNGSIKELFDGGLLISPAL